MTRPATPSQQEGPDNSPPKIPDGYVAQWDGTSKKFYYVETATGVSSWTVPEKASSSVPVVGPTPQPEGHPYSIPPAEGQRGLNDNPENFEGTDRSLISDLATNAILGKHGKPQGHSQSGLSGLASSILGGGGSNHGTGSNSGGHGGGGFGGIAGQLVGSLLDGGKPAKPSTGGQGGSSQTSNHQPGLMGMASGFLGGQHGSSNHSNNFGYSSSGHSNNGYSGEAPPASYQPGSGNSNSGPHGVSAPYQSQAPQSYQGAYGQPPQSSQTNLQSNHTNPSSQYAPSAPTMSGALEGHNKPNQGGYGQQHQSYPGSSAPPNTYGPSNSSTPNYGQQHQSYPPPGSSFSPYGQQQNQQYPPPPHGQQQSQQYPPPPHGQTQNQPYPVPVSQSAPYGQSSPYPPQQQQYQPPPYESYPQQHQSYPPQSSTPSYPGPPQNTPAYPPPPQHYQGQAQGGYNAYPPPPNMSSHPNQGQYPPPPPQPQQQGPGGYAGSGSYGHQEHMQGGYGQEQQSSGYGTGAPPTPGWRA